MKIRSTYLDKTFSLYIRTRDNFTCQHCGKSGGLMDCAHIYSRRHVGTRWDPLNAVCLCRGCHMRFTVEIHDWVAWVNTIRTSAELQLIQARARTVTKFTAKDREALNRDLRSKLKAMS